MIGADAHGAAKVFAELDEWGKVFADAIQLLGILLVGILADLEFFLIGVVAGIDPDFLHPFGGFKSGIGFEVDVCYQRHVTSRSTHAVTNVLEIGRIFLGLSGNPDDFTSRLGEVEHLLHACLCVPGVRGDHGLHPYWVISANANIANHDLTRLAA